MPLKTVTFHVRAWKGMDNKSSVTDVAPEAFVECQNIDLSTPFRLDKRMGYAKYNASVITASPTVNSLHRFVGNTEASLLAFCRDGTIRKSYAASGSFVDSRSGLTTTDVHASTVQFGGRRISSTNYAGRMFLVNGVDSNLTYSESDGWQTMGISAPATMPSLSYSASGLGSAAMLSGDYYFKITHYASAKGLESNPSQASPVFNVTAASGGIILSGFPVTADSQITDYRVYRIPSTAVGTYYLLATIPSSAATYHATAGDWALGTELAEDNDPPQKFKYIEEYNSCLFGAGDPTDQMSKSLVYYSKQLPDSPENWPLAYYIPASPDDGDEITLLKRLGDRLIVAKKNSWGVILGSTVSDFRYVQLDSAHGCIAPWTVALTENALVWLSNDGWRMCNGSTTVLLCEATMDLANLSLNYGQLDKFRASYYRKRKQYLCAICTGSNTTPNKVIKIQFPGGQWTEDSIQGTTDFLQYFDTNGEETLYMASASGQVFTMFGDSVHEDNSSNISWYFKTGPMYMGDYDRTKKFHTTRLFSDSSSSPVLSFQYAVNGGTLTSVRQVSATSDDIGAGMSQAGKYVQIKLSGSSDTYMRLKEMTVKANVEPERKW